MFNLFGSLLFVLSLTLPAFYLQAEPLPLSKNLVQSKDPSVYGGGSLYLDLPRDNICIPAETRKLVKSKIESFRASNEGGWPDLSRASSQLRYPFYPQGGTLYQDITTGNFVDLDPSAGVSNYLCETYGNDGHEGTDSGGLSWQEMAIGQPVFAVADGVVIDARDGDPDMNTSCQPNGNWVILDHGAGRETWYYHLKKNSVSVSNGEQVFAGQQLGLVASSGCSFGPHLHFQSMENGVVLEPFNGPCRLGTSLWNEQIDPPSSGAFVRDMGVTRQDIGAAPVFPDRAPIDNQILTSDMGDIYYWIQLGNLAVGSFWKERYVRPDGSTEFELGPFPFNNPTTFQFSQYWFYRVIGGMTTTPGTWRIQFEVNDELLVDAPVEVVSSLDPNFNRPPDPISASFDPAQPKALQTVFARIAPPARGTGYRDPDWNIVRYRYKWKVDGVTVRNTISVGMADALASKHVKAGSRVCATITAGDGVGAGALGETAQPVRICVDIPPLEKEPKCLVGGC